MSGGAGETAGQGASIDSSAWCHPDFVAAAGFCPFVHRSLTWIDDWSLSLCLHLYQCQFRLLYLCEPPRLYYNMAPPPHPAQSRHTSVSLYVLHLLPFPPCCLHISSAGLLTQVIALLFICLLDHWPNSQMHLHHLSQNNHSFVLHCWNKYNT